MKTTQPKRGRGASTHVQRRELVAEVCRRIAAGERLVDILRSPGMPIMPTFHAWVERSSELSAMYETAKAERARPPRSSMATARSYTAERGQALCEALMQAEGLDEALALPGMPCEMTVYRWLAEEPEFAALYRMAREVQAHRRFDMAWEAARHARWDGWRGAKLFIDTIRWQVAKLAPEAYGPPPRGAAEEPGPEPEVRVQVVRFFDDDGERIAPNP
jgi:hypothetical protein